MEIPDELRMVEHLIDVFAVTGLLRLIIVHLGDRAAEPGAPAYWSELAEIVAATARHTQQVEPQRIIRPEGGKSS